MLRVDKVLFSNVATAVQRTKNLTGGAVRGLPNGAVVEGLQGVSSFSAEVAEAQKEFELGRHHSAIQRVRQMESNFSGIVGRWNGTVGSILSSARQGKQSISLQKLNEVKNAEAKMRQLTGPATKAFRDLITAMEHMIAAAETSEADEQGTDGGAEAEKAEESESRDSLDKNGQDKPNLSTATPSPDPELPDPNLLGRFADKYSYGPKLRLKVGTDNKPRISPKLENGRFYFFKGLDPPTVVRIREIEPKSMVVFDAHQARERLIDTSQLRVLLTQGIWLLESKK